MGAIYNLNLKAPHEPAKLASRVVSVSVNGGVPTLIQVPVAATQVGPLRAPYSARVVHQVRNVARDGRQSAPATNEFQVIPAPEPVEFPEAPTVEILGYEDDPSSSGSSSGR